MWTRKELKDKAKIAFKANYWKAVLVGLLLAALMGGYGSFGSVPSTMANRTNAATYYSDTSYDSDAPSSVHVHVDGTDDSNSDAIDIVIDDLDEKLSIQDEEGNAVEIENPSPAATGFGAFFFGLSFLFLFLVIFALVLALDAFIFNPLEVGSQRFFLRNLNQPSEVKEVAHAFDTNYKNTVKGLFIRDLCIIAWSLLFIIPGIVKSYEYRMMPYLFADDPTMTKERAFAESKQMMTGQKWNAFVLDLSFLGWNILSAMTLGILGLFYVNPYQCQTNAALYEKLRYGLPAPAPVAAVGPQGSAPYAPNGQQAYASYAPADAQAYAPYGQVGYQPEQPMQAAPTVPLQPTTPAQAVPELQHTQPVASAGTTAVAPVIVPDSQPPIPPFAAADAPAPVWDDAETEEIAADDIAADEIETDALAEAATVEIATDEPAEAAADETEPAEESAADEAEAAEE